jgi:actinin alpha
MTYISEYFHRFAQQDVKELNARRVAKMVKFAREMNQQKSDYEDRAKALVAWVGGKIPELSEGKFGDSLDEANQAMTALRDYLVSEKPAKSGEKLDLEALFARIQTELQVNDRPPYQPPAELSPEAIDSVWDKLQLSEKKRGADVRANLFKFIKKAEARLSDEKVEEIKKAFLHFDKNNDNAMDKMEFKAANAALSVPFANDAAFNKAFEGVSEGKGTINLEQFTKYAIALQEDHDTPQQLQQAFRALADDADTITAAQLNIPPLTEADVKFLVDTMPSEGDKLDYKKFVARNFVQQ